MRILEYTPKSVLYPLRIGRTSHIKEIRRLEHAFRIILQDENVKAILINVFGGIVRCDRVAKGGVEAAQNIDGNGQAIVRPQGTNAEEGKKISDERGLKAQAASRVQESDGALQDTCK